MTLFPDGGAGIHQRGAGGAALLHRRRRGPLLSGAGRRVGKGAVFCPGEACRPLEVCPLPAACPLLEVWRLLAVFCPWEACHPLEAYHLPEVCHRLQVCHPLEACHLVLVCHRMEAFRPLTICRLLEACHRMAVCRWCVGLQSGRRFLLQAQRSSGALRQRVDAGSAGGDRVGRPQLPVGESVLGGRCRGLHRGRWGSGRQPAGGHLSAERRFPTTPEAGTGPAGGCPRPACRRRPA